MLTGMSFSQFSVWFDKHITEVFSFIGGAFSLGALHDFNITINSTPFLTVAMPYIAVVLKSILGGLVGYAVGRFLKRFDNKKDV